MLMAKTKLPSAVAKGPPLKRKRGRPPIDGVRGARYQVHLPVRVADWIRALGTGSLSQGIVHLVKGRMPQKNSATR